MRQYRHRVTVYMEPELHMELKLKAARTGYSMSDWVNDMVAKAFAKEEAEQKQAENELDKMFKEFERLTGNQ